MEFIIIPTVNKTLLRVLQSKEIIGDYELNFIASKAAQYEMLTNVTILKFRKDDYERVTFNREVKMREDKIKYLKKNFNFFSKMEEDQLFRLSKKIKQRNVQYNEPLILK